MWSKEHIQLGRQNYLSVLLLVQRSGLFIAEEHQSLTYDPAGVEDINESILKLYENLDIRVAVQMTRLNHKLMKRKPICHVKKLQQGHNHPPAT